MTLPGPMRHGRPSRNAYEFAGTTHRLVRSSDGIGWRREHAHRVFAAIQAVLAVVASWEQGNALWERGSAQETLEKCESMQRACGWLPK